MKIVIINSVYELQLTMPKLTMPKFAMKKTFFKAKPFFSSKI